MEQKLPRNLVDSFWKPFIIAVFNAEPDDTSAYMFVHMVKMGFIEKGNSVLVLPDDFLSNIYVEPAEKYLAGNGSEIYRAPGPRLRLRPYRHRTPSGQYDPRR